MPNDACAYLHRVDEIYRSDAYHSLSIEGYSVSPEVIEKVRRGGWSPEADEEDRKSRDALAARGYWADGFFICEFFVFMQDIRQPSCELVQEMQHL
jgi:hypothetical protein